MSCARMENKPDASISLLLSRSAKSGTMFNNMMTNRNKCTEEGFALYPKCILEQKQVNIVLPPPLLPPNSSLWEK